MSPFQENPGYRRLLDLGMPRADFAVAGSGPLFARGWITDPADVDVVARGAAWDLACRLGEVGPAPFSNVERVLLGDAAVEILNGWFPEIWTVDELIDGADVFDGVRFLTLDVVVRTKEMLHRPRDLVHLGIIRAHARA